MTFTPLRFFSRVLMILPLAFLAWYAVGSLLAAPAVWVSSMILTNWLPHSVASVSLDGTTMLVLSTMGELNGRIVPAEVAGYQLAFQINTLALSYSIPFFAALHFATPMPALWERFARALFVLWLLVVTGLVCTALKDLLLNLGDSFVKQPGVLPADVIALLYQFTTLMVPPLGPIFLWALSARHAPAVRAMLPAQLFTQGASVAAEVADAGDSGPSGAP